jgi:hypothetical protein
MFRSAGVMRPFIRNSKSSPGAKESCRRECLLYCDPQTLVDALLVVATSSDPRQLDFGRLVPSLAVLTGSGRNWRLMTVTAELASDEGWVLNNGLLPTLLMSFGKSTSSAGDLADDSTRRTSLLGASDSGDITAERTVSSREVGGRPIRSFFLLPPEGGERLIRLRLVIEGWCSTISETIRFIQSLGALGSLALGAKSTFPPQCPTSSNPSHGAI